MSEPENDRTISPVFYVVIAVFLWSTGGLFIKLTTLDAFSVNLGRSFFAAIIITLFTYKKGLRLDLFTVFTSLLYAATLTCFVYANKNTTAANAIFLQYTAPVYILILAPFVLKESFQVRDLITVVLCFAGMSLFFIESGGETPLAANIFTGNLAALISGVFFGVYILLLRHPRSLQRNPAVSAFYGNLIVVLVMLPLIAANPPGSISIADIGAILYLGCIQIGVSYLLFTIGIARGVRSMDASIIGFIEPLFNPIWVFLFVGERPSRWAILGGVVIIFAVLLHTLRQYRRRTALSVPPA